ncbi:MAG: pentapeptide repeat-containing protein [Sedimentisphaerales bacterium]|nr:pentapeptide repeat-containing protein [Sedimentisphaerales bacterium]
MNQQNQQPEKQKDHNFDPELLKKDLRCDLDQYEFLKECSKKGDEGIKQWNKWREDNPNEEILFQGADMKGWFLVNADLKKADLFYSDLKYAYLANANLECAYMYYADLKDSKFIEANLKSASLNAANIEGINLLSANLKGASFRFVVVDGATLIVPEEFDKQTDFTGVALDSCRIAPATKQLLEYNIRRKNWEVWYKYKNLQESEGERNIVIQKLMWFIKLFWSFSDYGRSTGRIIGCFLGLSLFFAAVYSLFAYFSPPGIVSHLEVEPHLPLWHYGLLVFLRPIYFSVVTMTTLGFGDMYANAQSTWGHILLTIQVILGYVLLGALVTRFAVLFTAGGPAGKFADEKKAESKKVKGKKSKIF